MVFDIFVMALLGASGGAAMTDPDDPDPRIVLELNAAQRDHVLTEMRGFLEGVAGVVDGLAYEDMESVAEAAGAIGPMGAGGGMAGLGMGDVLPKEFRAMGRATRKGFSDIEVAAGGGAEATEIQRLLSETLATCNACHSMYQIRRK